MLYVGTKNTVRAYQMDAYLGNPKKRPAPDSEPAEASQAFREVFKTPKAFVDCIRTSHGVLFAKSSDGAIYQCDPVSGEQVATALQVRGGTGVFDISRDGDYLCCGSEKGIVFVYEIKTRKCTTLSMS